MYLNPRYTAGYATDRALPFFGWESASWVVQESAPQRLSVFVFEIGSTALSSEEDPIVILELRSVEGLRLAFLHEQDILATLTWAEAIDNGKPTIRL